MNFKSIRLPEEFIDTIKEFADKEHRTLPQQIIHFAEIGKQIELRNWQLEQMRIGLHQAKSDIIAHPDNVKKVLEKCKNTE